MSAHFCSALIACRRLAASTFATTLVVAWVVMADQRGTGTTDPVPAPQGRGGGTALPAPVAPKPLVANAAPVRRCESLRDVTLRDTTIESAIVDAGNAQVPASCRVTAIVAHPATRDRIRVWIALPENDWNGRFQGVGGGGFSGGSRERRGSATPRRLRRRLNGHGPRRRQRELRARRQRPARLGSDS